MMYLIQVNFYTALMLLVYILLLRNKPMYGFSRMYLLLAAVLPLAIPFLELPKALQTRVQALPVLQFTLPEVTIGTVAKNGGPDFITIAWALYGLVALASLLYFARNLYRLQKIARSSKGERRDNYVLLSNSGFGPGSFGKYIFFPEAEVNDAILAHERAHISLHHTRDIIFFNLLQAFAWPSLLLFRIKKELKEVHEFQADAMAKEDRHSYAELLLSTVLRVRSLPEMHLFIIHPLKRRIMMLQKKNSGSPWKTALLVLAVVLSTVGAALVVQSCNKKVEAPVENRSGVLAGGVHGKEITKEEYDKEVKEMNGPKNGTKVIVDGHEYIWGKDFRVEVVPEPEVYSLADKMPEAPFDVPQFLAKNIHYPAEAKSKHVEGRVVVKFIIDRDGAVTDPQIVRSPDTLLSIETMRVINSMPKWKPGEQAGKKVRVYFTLPIVFKLQ